MKGFRSPAAKKAKKTNADTEVGAIINFSAVLSRTDYQNPLLQDTGDDDGGTSPSKPAPKKRGRVKKEELEDEAEEPAKKKPRAPAKKGKKVKGEEIVDQATLDEPASAPKQAAAKKGKQAKVKETDSKEAVKPKAKAAAKKHKDAREEEATADIDEAAAAAPEKAKAASKKGQKTDEAETEALKSGMQPKKARGRPPKAIADKVSDLNGLSPGVEQYDQAVKASEKAGATTNAANTKKPISKKSGKNVDAETAEALAEETPKAQKGRKKVNKSKKSQNALASAFDE